MDWYGDIDRLHDMDNTKDDGDLYQKNNDDNYNITEKQEQ